MKIKYKKTDEWVDVKAPLVTKGNACFDFYAPATYIIHSGRMGVSIGTGLAFEIPEGYHMKLFMRSSYGLKTPLRQSNCVGIIDSSYRGEVKGMFDNHSTETYCINAGDRFMQGLIEKNIPVEFEEAEELSKTGRGEDGFGSTGK